MKRIKADIAFESIGCGLDRHAFNLYGQQDLVDIKKAGRENKKDHSHGERDLSGKGRECYDHRVIR